MNKTVIATDKAPGAIGPYSQAVSANGMLFISGQLPIDPATGKMVEGDVGSKTRQIVKNIKEIIAQAGGSIEQVVKTTIFLTDLADFQEVNQAYGDFFQNNPPARSTVQVAALPLGSNIEIEAIVAL